MEDDVSDDGNDVVDVLALKVIAQREETLGANITAQIVKSDSRLLLLKKKQQQLQWLSLAFENIKRIVQTGVMNDELDTIEKTYVDLHRIYDIVLYRNELPNTEK